MNRETAGTKTLVSLFPNANTENMAWTHLLYFCWEILVATLQISHCI